MKVAVSWFSVKDFEQAKKFYGESLGLKKTFEMEQWAEFAGADGEASIGVAVNSHSGEEPGATVVLQVPDIERERKRLEFPRSFLRRKDRRNSRYGQTRNVSRSFRQPLAALPSVNAFLDSQTRRAATDGGVNCRGFALTRRTRCRFILSRRFRRTKK
jgi:catechol 2,3-dioxygenase-like lactoylglutathione lyase family enzyme